MKTKLASVSVLGLACALGCSSTDSDAGKGSVAFSTWGEEYIEQELPASEIEDGWSVKFTKFMVNFQNVTVADSGGLAKATLAKPKLFDMHKNGGPVSLVTFADLPAQNYSKVSFEIAPVTAEAELAPSATQADKDAMVAGKLSVYVEGAATKGAVTKTFKWGFGTATQYADCRGEKSGKEVAGVVITNGGTDDPQLTIHGDHFFYDDLQSPDAKVRFNAIALADDKGDKNGEVTLEELSKVELVALKAEAPYGTGSASGVNDLRAFVTALSRTVGHFRGEGECTAIPK
jgi:hypothetical protein